MGQAAVTAVLAADSEPKAWTVSKLAIYIWDKRRTAEPITQVFTVSKGALSVMCSLPIQVLHHYRRAHLTTANQL